MKDVKFIFLPILFCTVLLLSCYTKFNIPAGTDESPAQTPDIMFFDNPSVPWSMHHNYSWNYYYGSAWWLQSEYDYGNDGSRVLPEPRDFDRRQPADNNTSSGLSGVSISNPGLSKRANNDSAAPAPSKPDDGKRDFDRRTPEKKDSGDRKQPSRERKN